jgi:hypothetical protein
MRRASLFFGAAILGIWCAVLFEHASGAPLQSVLSNSSVAFSALFVAIGVALAVVSHDRFLRAAWIVFAVQHVLNLVLLNVRTSPAVWASSILTGSFATLLIVAGAKRRTARVLAIAAAVFVGAMIVRIVVTGYARRVLSGHSVVETKASRRQGAVISCASAATSTSSSHPKLSFSSSA